jgi:hypothetical protein
MGWGPTLLGGVAGAAVGVALHVALEMGVLGRQISAPWFVVFTGLLTGLGVRLANKSLAGRVSYMRGAVAAVIALAGILLTFPAMKYALTVRGESETKEALANRGENKPADADADASDEPAEGTDVDPGERRPANLEEGVGVVGEGGRMPNPQDFNLKMAIYMALGALLAYDFGRGVGARRAAPESSAPPPDEPVATDPSN